MKLSVNILKVEHFPSCFFLSGISILHIFELFLVSSNFFLHLIDLNCWRSTISRHLRINRLWCCCCFIDLKDWRLWSYVDLFFVWLKIRVLDEHLNYLINETLWLKQIKIRYHNFFIWWNSNKSLLTRN